MKLLVTAIILITGLLTLPVHPGDVAFTSETGPNGLSSADSIRKKVLQFTDSDFFKGNQELLSERENELLDMNYMGIAVNGPRKIFCDSQEAVPVVVAVRSSGKRGRHVNLQKNCFTVATDMNNGKVIVAKTFVDPKERKAVKDEAPMKGSDPPGLSLVSANVAVVNVREQIPVVCKTGRWSLSLLYYDWLSNGIDIQLIGNKSEPSPREVNEVTPAPDLSDSTALPCYSRTSQPPPDAGDSVVFALKYYLKKGKKHLTATGSFSLHAREYHRVKNGTCHVFKNGTKKRVIAIVPVTFIMLSLDCKTPLQFDWDIPVYAEKGKAGTPVTGFFAIDLFDPENTVSLTSGTYVCYSAMDGTVYGPQKIVIP